MGELTETQRAALRWVVRTVRAVQLRETLQISWLRGMDGSERAALRGFTGDPASIPPLSEGTFAVLVAEGYLAEVFRPGSIVTRTYTVRQAAYDAVDREAAGGAAAPAPGNESPPPASKIINSTVAQHVGAQIGGLITGVNAGTINYYPSAPRAPQFNLTRKQEQTLRWLVTLYSQEQSDEHFTFYFVYGDDTETCVLDDYPGTMPPFVSRAVLVSLEREQALTCIEAKIDPRGMLERATYTVRGEAIQWVHDHPLPEPR